MIAYSRSKPPSARRRAGFALLVVIWGIGLISMLVVSFMTSGRLRLQAAHNIAASVSAGYIADAVINLTTLALLSRQNAAATKPPDAVDDSAPRFCIFDNAAVAVAIEDEGGKIDLNAAPVEALQLLLRGVGLAESAAQDVSQSIVAFRTSAEPGASGEPALLTPVKSDKPVSLKQGPFETVTELDQVGGVDPVLYRLLLRFVTVNSGSPGIDPRVAPPGLFAALAGFPVEDVRGLAATPFPNSINRKDSRFPANLNQTSEHVAFLIHAEVLLNTGQTLARDALLDLRPATGKPFTIKEVRGSNSAYSSQLRAMLSANASGSPNC